MKLKNQFFILFAAMTVFSTSAGFCVGYIRIGGIPGDAKDFEHEDWLEIISLDQGPHRWTQRDNSLSDLPRISIDEGEGTLTVTRYAKKPIADIYAAVIFGTYFSSVAVELPMNVSGQKSYIRLDLSDAVITEVNIRKPEGLRRMPIEQITMTFDHATWDKPDPQEKRSLAEQKPSPTEQTEKPSLPEQKPKPKLSLAERLGYRPIRVDTE